MNTFFKKPKQKTQKKPKNPRMKAHSSSLGPGGTYHLAGWAQRFAKLSKQRVQYKVGPSQNSGYQHFPSLEGSSDFDIGACSLLLELEAEHPPTSARFKPKGTRLRSDSADKGQAVLGQKISVPGRQNSQKKISFILKKSNHLQDQRKGTWKALCCHCR